MENRDDQFINLLKKLIETPSLSKEEDRTARILMDFFASKSIEVKRIKNNVILRTKYFDPEKPTILPFLYIDVDFSNNVVN